MLLSKYHQIKIIKLIFIVIIIIVIVIVIVIFLECFLSLSETVSIVMNMPGVGFTIVLERRPYSYVLNIIIPTVVLAVLSALSFIVPVDSGEKMSLGISILVAFSVFMLILQDNTPQADSPLLGE